VFAEVDDVVSVLTLRIILCSFLNTSYLIILTASFFFPSSPIFVLYEVSCLCFFCSLLYRYNEFGVDGGPSAKALKPKIDTFAHRIHSQVGFQLPEIDVSISLPLSTVSPCVFANVYVLC
jgi:hypothetical protein